MTTKSDHMVGVPKNGVVYESANTCTRIEQNVTGKERRCGSDNWPRFPRRGQVSRAGKHSLTAVLLITELIRQTGDYWARRTAQHTGMKWIQTPTL
jgi:hypothetical protein